MSAFQVSPNHIGAILRWYLFDGITHEHDRRTWRDHYPTSDDALDMAACLAFECHRSVSYRYPGDAAKGELPGPIAFESTPVIVDTENLGVYKALSAIAVIKACHCLEYQSCEHPEWRESEARQLLHDIIDCAVYRIPGYDAAEWEVAERATYEAISIMDLIAKKRRR